MSVINADLLAQFAGLVDKIVHPIEFRSVLDDSPKSDDLREMLDELAACSENISVTHGSASSDAKRAPFFRIERTGTEIGVGFAGLPLGHEFTSLILAILQVGGHPPRIDDDVAEQIRGIEGEHNFEVFFSLSCQNCPDVVQALNTMSVLNPNITVTSIDGALFQDEVEGREVKVVPTVFRNDDVFERGRVGIEQILGRLDDGAESRAAAKIDEMDPFDVLVVGGGPGGAAAAIYAARKGLRTGVVADRFGGQLLDTMGIENFISVPYTEGPRLSAQLEEQTRGYDVEIMVPQRASGLTPAAEAGGLHRVGLESGATIESRSVVVSTGARWRHLDVPGESDYLNRGVAFCPHCDGPLFKGKKVAVVGGGNSGVEAAIDLAGIVEHVTLLEFQAELLADDVLQRTLHAAPNITVLTNAATSAIIGDGTSVTGLTYVDRTTDSEIDVDVAGVFVQIGLLPNCC